ncbi:hypothetical protein KMAL_32120 [Novacetimonas maltaceti]|uniref:Uncharacterized protein n=1 Tax=Novacetimonas maltaceti TaxID=1203393 RepID=A0A2S3VY05_9PROT|nr:hypothetical protein KMAL_32120 [Novacetimonas maltaceti]
MGVWDDAATRAVPISGRPMHRPDIPPVVRRFPVADFALNGPCDPQATLADGFDIGRVVE